MNYMVTEVAQLIKEDLDKKANCTSYGEPQVFFALDDGRSIEVVIEQEGLSPDQYFYSASLHCTEAEFDNGDFTNTNGVIERYVSRDLSLEELWEVVGAALVCYYEKPVAAPGKAVDKVSLPSADVLNQMLIYMINTYTDEKYGVSGDFETIKEDIISATGMSEAHFEAIQDELDFVCFMKEQQYQNFDAPALEDQIAAASKANKSPETEEINHTEQVR